MVSVRALAGTAGLRIGALIVNFASSVLIARSLGVSDRGLFQLIVTVAALVAAIGGLSAELAYAEAYARHATQRANIVATACWSGIAWGGVLAALVGAVLWALGDRSSVRGGLLLLLCIQVWMVLWQVWLQRGLLIDGKYHGAAGVLALDAALRLGGVLVLIGLGPSHARISWVLGAILVATLLSQLWGLRLSGSRPTQVSGGLILASLRRGVRYHPGQVALALLMRLDVVLVTALAGLVATGWYAVGVSLTGPLAVVATSIGTTFLQRQLISAEEEAREATEDLASLTMAVLLPAVLLLAVSVPVLIPTVWGTEFAGAIVPTLLLLPGVLALSAQRAIGSMLVREGMTRALNLRALVAVAVNVALGIALIPEQGAAGAAIASSVAYLAYSLLSFATYARLTSQPLLPTIGRCVTPRYQLLLRGLRP